MLSFLRSVAPTPRGTSTPSTFIAPMALPDGFPWAPDFSIFENEGVYSTNYDPADDKPAGSPVFVSTTGDDGTGTGSEAAPFRTIAHARTIGSVVHIKAGVYADSHGDFEMGVLTDTAFVAVDGPGTVIWVSTPDTLVWTLESGNTYRASVSTTVNDVVDRTHMRAGFTLKDGSAGVPLLYSEQSSIANVDANAGSFFHDGTTLYVRTHDNRAPDADVLPLWDKDIWSETSLEHVVYLEGIEFWGAKPLEITGLSDVDTAKIVTVDCGFRYAPGDGCAKCDRIAEIRHVRSEASDSYEDGFSYTNSLNSVTQHALEYDCASYRNGRNPSGANNNNASTGHYDCNIIRLNSLYDESQGPVVADVLGVQAVCINCDARNANSSSGDDHVSDAGFSCGSFGLDGETTRMWLIDCAASGNGFDRGRSTGGVVISDANFVGGANDDSGTIIALEDGYEPALYNDLTGWYDMDDTASHTAFSTLVQVADKSPRRKSVRQNTSSLRPPLPAPMAGKYNGRSVCSPDDRTENRCLPYQTNVTVGDLYIVASYKDGVDAAFDDFETLFSQNYVSGTAYVAGAQGTADISAGLVSAVEVNGAAASSTVLPLPLSIIRITPAAPFTDRAVFFHDPANLGRGWVGDIAEMLVFETAQDAAADAALRGYLAAKWGI